MADFDFKRQKWDSSANSGLNSETGVGFQPKAIVFTGGLAVSSNIDYADHCRYVGLVDGTNQYYGVYGSRPIVGSSETRRRQGTTHCTHYMDPTDPSFIDGSCTFVSFDADGWTCDWDNSTPDFYDQIAFCFGGDELTAFVGTVDNSGGDADITAIGFQPDIIITVSTLTGDVLGGNTFDGAMSIGFAARNGSVYEQKCFAFFQPNGFSSHDMGLIGQDGVSCRDLTETALLGGIEWKDPDSSGATAGQVAGAGVVAGYMALSLGASGKAGIVKRWSTPTATGDQDLTDMGSPVDAMMTVASWLEAADWGSIKTAGDPVTSFHIGGSGPSTASSASTPARIRVGSGSALVSTRYATSLYLENNIGTATIEGDVSGTLPTGVRLNFTTVDTLAREWFRMDIGDAPTGGALVGHADDTAQAADTGHAVLSKVAEGADDVDPTDEGGSVLALAREGADTVEPTDAPGAARTMARQGADGVDATDAPGASRTMSREGADDVDPGDEGFGGKAIMEFAADTVVSQDAGWPALGIVRAAADGVEPTDEGRQLITVGILARSGDDVVSPTDEAVQRASVIASAQDLVEAVDAAHAARVVVRHADDFAELVDEAVRSGELNKAGEDIVQPADAAFTNRVIREFAQDIVAVFDLGDEVLGAVLPGDFGVVIDLRGRDDLIAALFGESDQVVDLKASDDVEVALEGQDVALKTRQDFEMRTGTTKKPTYRVTLTDGRTFDGGESWEWTAKDDRDDVSPVIQKTSAVVTSPIPGDDTVRDVQFTIVPTDTSSFPPLPGSRDLRTSVRMTKGADPETMAEGTLRVWTSI